jgi:hypothetical protein
MAKTRQHCGLAALVCMFAGIGIAPAWAQTATEIVLHNFGIQPHGAVPDAGVGYKVNNYGQQTVPARRRYCTASRAGRMGRTLSQA